MDASSLSPRLSRLLFTLRTPGWRRVLFFRRMLAACLLALAAVIALGSRGHSDPQVVVVAHDVPAGTTLQDSDLSTKPVPASALAADALQGTDGLAQARGQVVVSAASAGEILTPSRLVSQGRVDFPGDPGAPPLTLVPVALATAEVIPLLVHGDTVSVVTHEADTPQPRVIAESARVVLPGAPTGTSSATEHTTLNTVLLALPEGPAQAVAAAALTSPLALIVTGDRARVPKMSAGS